jgi:hypothetical protein
LDRHSDVHNSLDAAHRGDRAGGLSGGCSIVADGVKWSLINRSIRIPMRNQLQTWFLEADENALSHALRQSNQGIFFIDRNHSGEDDVAVRSNLQDCKTIDAWIWDAATEEPAEAAAKWRECVRNKSVGAAVQFTRSRMIHEELVNEASANVLISGRVAACFRGKGTLEQITLKRTVYKAVDAIASSNIRHVSPTSRESIGEYLGGRVGRHAAKWCETPGNLLRHSGVYCLPAESAEEGEH